MISKLRAWARREPVLAVRLVGAAAGLATWVAARSFNVQLDIAEISAVALVALGVDTLVTREGVYAPATVDRLEVEARTAGAADAQAAPVTAVYVDRDSPPPGPRPPIGGL